MPARLVILVERLGPYHAARFRAVARCVGEDNLHVIEVAGGSQRYPWDRVDGVEGANVQRLFPATDYAQLRRTAIRKAVREALGALRFDVVAVNGWGFSEAREAVRWARRAGRAVVLMSDSQERDAYRPWLKEILKRSVVKRCDAALVAGRSHAAYARKLGMASERIVLGYDVVDNDHFSEGAAAARENAVDLRARLGLPDRFWLVCARFIAKKNLDGAIEAYACYARRTGPRAWGLVLVGDGPEGPALWRRATLLGMQTSVVFTGFVQYPNLPQYYGLAAGFLLPSATEQWGLVVNEAMAAGLPVLVSDACGCAPDLVQEGVNGFTFPAGDNEALARLMIQVATSSELAAMGTASRRIIASWTPETFAQNMERAATLAIEHAAARGRR